MVLRLAAINPQQRGWLLASLGIIARWEVTCGFCRTRFTNPVFEMLRGSVLSEVRCPACGTLNLLPHHPALRPPPR
jgi:LSD1 subclass zinc finger protein